MGIKHRRQREREERRRQILKAAKTVFHSYGYEDSGIVEIAEFAELSPATVYLYFPGKKALFSTVFSQILDDFHQRLINDEIENPEPASMDKRLHVLCQSLADFYEQAPELIRYGISNGDAEMGIDKGPIPGLMNSIRKYVELRLPEIAAKHKSQIIARLVCFHYIGSILMNEVVHFSVRDKKSAVYSDLSYFLSEFSLSLSSNLAEEVEPCAAFD
jgi:AcrR family transcriptional regulator